jgi:hypothetical protein
VAKTAKSTPDLMLFFSEVVSPFFDCLHIRKPAGVEEISRDLSRVLCKSGCFDECIPRAKGFCSCCDSKSGS